MDHRTTRGETRKALRKACGGPEGESRGNSTLTGEELESILLSDLEGLYQSEAAGMMKISRATYARLVFSARRKIAESLFRGDPVIAPGGAGGAILRGIKCPIHRRRGRGGRLCLCGGDKKNGL